MQEQGAIRSFRDLHVWKLAFELTTAIYRATAGMPDHERFGMVSQMRRAAVSVVSNIAEGNGRAHRAEYLHHLTIAFGSLCELEAQLLVSAELGYLPESASKQLLRDLANTGRLLRALQKSLRKST